jgi:hypothetical protein
MPKLWVWKNAKRMQAKAAKIGETAVRAVLHKAVNPAAINLFANKTDIIAGLTRNL